MSLFLVVPSVYHPSGLYGLENPWSDERHDETQVDMQMHCLLSLALVRNLAIS